MNGDMVMGIIFGLFVSTAIGFFIGIFVAEGGAWRFLEQRRRMIHAEKMAELKQREAILGLHPEPLWKMEQK